MQNTIKISDGQIPANLEGIVRNLPLRKTEALLPVYEAVVNSIQAIDERKDLEMADGNISVIINRGLHKNLNGEKDDTIVGFEIRDNGCGFDEINYQSFLNLHSPHKWEIGGKGIGRFTWLKVFEKVEIESVFLEKGQKFKRIITFTTKGIVGQEPVKTEEDIQTCVKLIGFKNEYRQQESAFRTTEKIAQRILEHCLSYYVGDNYPHIHTISEEVSKDLTSMFNELKNGIREENFKLANIDFKLIHVIMFNTVQDLNKSILCAHNRAVSSHKIDFLEKTSLSFAGKKCYYSAYILSDYLDENVESDRLNFRIPSIRDLDTETFPVTREMILKEVEKHSRLHLKEYTEQAEKTKKDKLNQYFLQNPHFKFVYKYYSKEILDEINPESSEEKINDVLYKYKGKAEYEKRKEVEKILKTNKREVLKQKNEEIFKQLDELQKDNLTSYVIHRKLILDLFEKSLELNDDGKYPFEREIHDIIFPRKTDSEKIDYDDHNLWLIDESLTFHSYAASDMKLKNISDSDSDNRPDVIIFSEVNENNSNICNSVSIIELKRSQTDDRDIVNQLYTYIENIQNCTIKRENGRDIKTTDSTKFFCYALCDPDDKIKQTLKRHKFKEMYNGAGYYLFHEDYNAYMEVLSYDWISVNAKQRLKIYFEKLGI
ncbi:ATP-binding protein [Methanimicrococcus blatticola]|uniref:Histidine kinase/DNA gyrase B/HSP90-like ATPase n=1 Tax=Methanimicrococcus blatticola TaxID=91560 RepID=A0A484F5F4_9EURY|nr:ATP-binding protein [Methanimicrococcus blatticola]MBZ3934932.1 tryptophan 2,3-dioxygenase [Methanimicrococcus blatticola]MCC2508969.1 ATP-binding protein [Methanimicrococcus blatticola]TDQ71000.1 histidine kinase/DNA gyrase B/HSP90-like ATPase [Methanimicrococcus blatticola]